MVGGCSGPSCETDVDTKATPACRIGHGLQKDVEGGVPSGLLVALGLGGRPRSKDSQERHEKVDTIPKVGICGRLEANVPAPQPGRWKGPAAKETGRKFATFPLEPFVDSRGVRYRRRALLRTVGLALHEGPIQHGPRWNPGNCESLRKIGTANADSPLLNVSFIDRAEPPRSTGEVSWTLPAPVWNSPESSWRTSSPFGDRDRERRAIAVPPPIRHGSIESIQAGPQSEKSTAPSWSKQDWVLKTLYETRVIVEPKELSSRKDSGKVRWHGGEMLGFVRTGRGSRTLQHSRRCAMVRVLGWVGGMVVKRKGMGEQGRHHPLGDDETSGSSMTRSSSSLSFTRTAMRTSSPDPHSSAASPDPSLSRLHLFRAS
ncbi:hypothetical protein DFH06DRAFT_1347867 [Mycena polygramma]|nr:hypothetical protein DFH06DRAFT_1347867 [Mycena polygramma]